MKKLLAIVMLLACSVCLSQDLSEAAKFEALRRGSHVEVVGGGPEGEADLLAEVTASTDNENAKWFISVVTEANCQPCERLKYDLANSPYLTAFTDKQHGNSHLNIYRREDMTQAWRFANMNLTNYPAIVIQPPANGMYGPSTDYLVIYGYKGDAKQLAKQISAKMANRAAAYKRPSQKAIVKGAESGHEAPWEVMPPDLDGERPLAYPTYRRSVGGLVDGILSLTPLAFFPGNELLLIAAAVAGVVILVRKYRQSQGKTLLIDDATASKIVDAEKALVIKLASKYGLTVQSSPG